MDGTSIYIGDRLPTIYEAAQAIYYYSPTIGWVKKIH